MLDFFFRHYEPWVDRFYILDDASDDGTREYLESRDDVVVADLERSHPDSWVLSAKDIYDTAWRQSIGQATWVVVTNIDEHLFCPRSVPGDANDPVPSSWGRRLRQLHRLGQRIAGDGPRAHRARMRGYLRAALENGVTAIPALGYQMLTETFPEPDSLLWRDCRIGMRWIQMSKMGIFRPDCISETRFTFGRHRADFRGDVVLPSTDRLLNLHYKYLGLDYTHRRHLALEARLGSGDRARNFGHKYRWSRDRLGEDFAECRARSHDIRLADVSGDDGEDRWWRNPEVRLAP